MGGSRLVCASLLAALVAGAGGSSSAAPSTAAPRYSAPPRPVLVDAAMREGRLDTATGTLYLAYALFAPEKLPREYRSGTPFHGTYWLLQVQNALPALAPGLARTEIESFLGPGARGGTWCGGALDPSPDRLETAHFIIDYDAAEVNNGRDNLTIEDYGVSLEGAWKREIEDFGWARVPTTDDNDLPGRKYLVKLMELPWGLYGYATTIGTGAGFVGDNPYTEWDEHDARGSCIVLDADYKRFPGTPARALDATTAHEFNHSIQFGLGGMNGPKAAEALYIEGGATWMEDEVYTGANDNYNWLWPSFEDDLGHYTHSQYEFWVFFRALTERYGTGVPDGGEDVMQRFWELTSRGSAGNLDAMDQALRAEGTTIEDAYHAAAIALKFNRACGGGYVYPYCLKEGPDYIHGDGVQDGAGRTRQHGRIERVGQRFRAALPDKFSLNWILLPTGRAPYRVTLRNTSNGGLFRASVACDTGSEIRITPFPADLESGRSGDVVVSNADGCTELVAVVTNIAWSRGQIDRRPAPRTYTLTTS
jgi:hypothetical protein